MNIRAINQKLLSRLKDKKYRDAFVASQLNQIIPYQIRALRAARDNMTQEELAERAETTQSVISRIQNRGAANLNIKTLLKLASAFDVALTVRFEPIDRFIDWIDDLSPNAMSPKASEQVLAESERRSRKATNLSIPKRTSTHQLQVINSSEPIINSSEPTTWVQLTLPLDRPRILSESVQTKWITTEQPEITKFARVS